MFLMGPNSNVELFALFKRNAVTFLFAPFVSFSTIQNDFSFVQSIGHVENQIAVFHVFSRAQIDVETTFRQNVSLYDHRLAWFQLTLDGPQIRHWL